MRWARWFVPFRFRQAELGFATPCAGLDRLSYRPFYCWKHPCRPLPGGSKQAAASLEFSPPVKARMGAQFLSRSVLCPNDAQPVNWTADEDLAQLRRVPLPVSRPTMKVD